MQVYITKINCKGNEELLFGNKVFISEKLRARTFESIQDAENHIKSWGTALEGVDGAVSIKIFFE